MADLFSPASNTQQDDPPFTYTFPNTFTIGNKQTQGPLVTPEQVKGHLGLLRLFKGLREIVEAGEDDRLPTWSIHMEPERRWAWFVGLAAERFERWCKAVKYVPLSQFIEESLPPLDVMMVWHAFLLNPGWYAEDTIRQPVLRNLSHLNEIFVVSLPNIDGLLSLTPSSRRLQNWFKMTSTPFDPLDSAGVLEKRTIQCPKCRNPVAAPFHTAVGSGYGQQNFRITCPCSFEIDKDKLGSIKFVRDLIKDDNGVELNAYLAGTLYTPTNTIDVARARLVKRNILKCEAFSKSTQESHTDDKTSDHQWEDQILILAQYSLNNLKAYTEAHMPEGGGGQLLNRIISAYADGNKVFSVNLAGAVLRQGSFIQKMDDLGWTVPSYYDSKDGRVALQHSVTRYHAFLDLMTSSPMSFFVPTLDIDLAWHTHQLRAKQYRQDCSTYVGRYVDHDDKVEENYLSTAFDATCRAWKARFKIAYMRCGCPPPGDTLKQKVLSKLNRKSQFQQSLFLSPLHPVGTDFLQATHPSDHNSVFAFHLQSQSEASRRSRRTKVMKRRQRDAEKVKQGKFDGESYHPGEEHGQAFLTPIPACHVYGYGGCTAFHGGVYGAGACAVGAGACAVSASVCGSRGECAAGSES